MFKKVTMALKQLLSILYNLLSLFPIKAIHRDATKVQEMAEKALEKNDLSDTDRNSWQAILNDAQQ